MEKSEKKILVRVFSVIFISLVIELFLFYPGQSILVLLIEIRASDVVGAIGTIYALISAFILNNVWSNFKEAEQAVREENEAIINIWNSADYFDDLKESSKMEKALVDYIEYVQKNELSHEFRMYSILPCEDFLNIQHVIDSTSVETKRDEIVFASIISTYESLSRARNKRISRLASDMPMFLKLFYVSASIILWGGFAFEGFESPVLYLLVNLGITIIIVLNYYLIEDFDKPLDGFIRVNFDGYTASKNYIIEAKHS